MDPPIQESFNLEECWLNSDLSKGYEKWTGAFEAEGHVTLQQTHHKDVKDG